MAYYSTGGTCVSVPGTPWEIMVIAKDSSHLPAGCKSIVNTPLLMMTSLFAFFDARQSKERPGSSYSIICTKNTEQEISEDTSDKKELGSSMPLEEAQFNLLRHLGGGSTTNLLLVFPRAPKVSYAFLTVLATTKIATDNQQITTRQTSCEVH